MDKRIFKLIALTLFVPIVVRSQQPANAACQVANSYQQSWYLTPTENFAWDLSQQFNGYNLSYSLVSAPSSASIQSAWTIKRNISYPPSVSSLIITRITSDNNKAWTSQIVGLQKNGASFIAWQGVMNSSQQVQWTNSVDITLAKVMNMTCQDMIGAGNNLAYVWCADVQLQAQAVAYNTQFYQVNFTNSSYSVFDSLHIGTNQDNQIVNMSIQIYTNPLNQTFLLENSLQVQSGSQQPAGDSFAFQNITDPNNIKGVDTVQNSRITAVSDLKVQGQYIWALSFNQKLSVWQYFGNGQISIVYSQLCTSQCTYLSVAQRDLIGFIPIQDFLIQNAPVQNQAYSTIQQYQQDLILNGSVLIDAYYGPSITQLNVTQMSDNQEYIILKGQALSTMNQTYANHVLVYKKTQSGINLLYDYQTANNAVMIQPNLYPNQLAVFDSNITIVNLNTPRVLISPSGSVGSNMSLQIQANSQQGSFAQACSVIFYINYISQDDTSIYSANLSATPQYYLNWDTLYSSNHFPVDSQYIGPNLRYTLAINNITNVPQGNMNQSSPSYCGDSNQNPSNCQSFTQIMMKQIDKMQLQLPSFINPFQDRPTVFAIMDSVTDLMFDTYQQQSTLQLNKVTCIMNFVSLAAQSCAQTSVVILRDAISYFAPRCWLDNQGLISTSAQVYNNSRNTVYFTGQAQNITYNSNISDIRCINNKLFVVVPSAQTVDTQQLSQFNLTTFNTTLISSINSTTTQRWGIQNFFPQFIKYTEIYQGQVFIISTNQVIIANLQSNNVFSLVAVVTGVLPYTTSLDFNLAVFYNSLVILSRSEVQRIDEYSIEDFSNIFLRKTLPLYNYTLDSTINYDYTPSANLLYIKAQNGSNITNILIYRIDVSAHQCLYSGFNLGFNANQQSQPFILTAAGVQDSKLFYYPQQATSGNQDLKGSEKINLDISSTGSDEEFTQLKNDVSQKNSYSTYPAVYELSARPYAYFSYNYNYPAKYLQSYNVSIIGQKKGFLGQKDAQFSLLLGSQYIFVNSNQINSSNINNQLTFDERWGYTIPINDENQFGGNVFNTRFTSSYGLTLNQHIQNVPGVAIPQLGQVISMQIDSSEFIFALANNTVSVFYIGQNEVQYQAKLLVPSNQLCQQIAVDKVTNLSVSICQSQNQSNGILVAPTWTPNQTYIIKPLNSSLLLGTTYTDFVKLVNNQIIVLDYQHSVNQLGVIRIQQQNISNTQQTNLSAIAIIDQNRLNLSSLNITSFDIQPTLSNTTQRLFILDQKAGIYIVDLNLIIGSITVIPVAQGFVNLVTMINNNQGQVTPGNNFIQIAIAETQLNSSQARNATVSMYKGVVICDQISFVDFTVTLQTQNSFVSLTNSWINQYQLTAYGIMGNYSPLIPLKQISVNKDFLVVKYNVTDGTTNPQICAYDRSMNNSGSLYPIYKSMIGGFQTDNTASQPSNFILTGESSNRTNLLMSAYNNLSTLNINRTLSLQVYSKQQYNQQVSFQGISYQTNNIFQVPMKILQSPGSSMPWWAILLICLGSVAIMVVIGFFAYKKWKSRHSYDNTPLLGQTEQYKVVEA